MGSALVRGCASETRSEVVRDSESLIPEYESEQHSEKSSINAAAACNISEQHQQQRTPKRKGRLRSVVVIQVVPADMDGEELTNRTTHTVASKLEGLLRQLDAGVNPDPCMLREGISLALLALSNVECADVNEDEVLNSVSNTQVRAWLATTFTRHEQVTPNPCSPLTPKERFKAVANTIIIGKYFENIVREPTSFTGPQYPFSVGTLLQESLDCWEFPIFRLEAQSSGNVLRYVGYELFKKHNLFDRFNISPLIFDNFLSRIEADYSIHGNPYHNATHGADVAQTVHYFIQQSSLKVHLTHLDILSLLLSAIIHDVNHPGTSNTFQIGQMSDLALMYNDRSVLENHHLHHTFKLFREKQYDILSGLSPDDYKAVRSLVIDMVLATDMSTHFEQLKNIKQTISCANGSTQLLTTDRSKTFSLILHLADISHPGKAWNEHLEWSDRLCGEFFKQGDRERDLGIPLSPLCDRDNTNVPESQLGFIEYIVAPSYDVCGTIFEMVAEIPSCDSDDQSHDISWPWNRNIDINKLKWKTKKAENCLNIEAKITTSNSNQMAVQSVSSIDEQPLTDGGKVPVKPCNGTMTNGLSQSTEDIDTQVL